MGGRRGAPGGALLGRVPAIWLAHPELPRVWPGPGRGWAASRFVFIFNSLYCSNHLRATENKSLSSADLRFLASIVRRLLILASDHFHPRPPPKGRHTPRIAPGRGAAVSVARVPTAIWPGVGAARGLPRGPPGPLSGDPTPLGHGREEEKEDSSVSPFKQKPGCFWERSHSPMALPGSRTPGGCNSLASRAKETWRVWGPTWRLAWPGPLPNRGPGPQPGLQATTLASRGQARSH